jgi:hypothetical protein
MRTFLAVTLLSLSAVLIWPSRAAAQTEADARAMFEEGNGHLERGLRLRGQARARELRDALNLYHRALRVTRSRNVIFNIALAYEGLERFEDAYAYFSEYVAIDDLSEEDRREGEHHLATLTPRIALVEVTSQPPGATIYVDRRDLSPRGVTPATIATQPGSHRVILVLDGHEPGEAPVEAALGQTRQVSVALAPRPATVHVETDPPGAEVRFDAEDATVAGVTPLTTTLPAGQHRIYVSLDDRAGRENFVAPPGGEITVPVQLAAPTTPGDVAINVDTPGAIVVVDGIEVGQAPIRQLRLTPGVHRISVVGDAEHLGWSETVEVGPGHEIAMNVHLALATPRRRFGVWPGVGMAVAVAIGVAAAATGGWALSLHDDFQDIASTCGAAPQACAEGTVYRAEAYALEDRIRQFAIATDVLIATAAAVGITSFALMLLNREIADTSRVEIALSPTEGGLFASLRFRGMLQVSP